MAHLHLTKVLCRILPKECLQTSAPKMQVKMKFRHRMAAVVVLISLVFIIHIVKHIFTCDTLRWLNLGWYFYECQNPTRHITTRAAPSSSIDRDLVSVISTVDLYQATNFSVDQNGAYVMPNPPEDYPSEPQLKDLEFLDVIIVPFSHVDPGWLSTTEEYYHTAVRQILDNAVQQLIQHPDMTFLWAETVFLHRWWTEIDSYTKAQFRRLVHRGQIEICLGGWVMPDEASTHYVSVIDQLVEGHKWLWDNLQVIPKTSWSIDPFGHSGTLPYLWKLSGMDNMVIQRVHQAVKASLMSRNSLEFWWRQFWDKSGSTRILCHVMPYRLYRTEYACGPDPLTCRHFDFRKVHGEETDSLAVPITAGNVKEFSQLLYQQFRQKAYHYKTHTLLVPLGDDFRFASEEEWQQQYGNYSLLMQYMNSKTDWKVRVKFGTVSEYFQLVRKKAKAINPADFPVLAGDFFPYSDVSDAYWTGYFTTRPSIKRLQREIQGDIQAADILITLTYALLKKTSQLEDSHTDFGELLSLMQGPHRSQGHFLHHDAITGTCTDLVAEDFEEELLAAYGDLQSAMRLALVSLAGEKLNAETLLSERPLGDASMPPQKVVLALRKKDVWLTVFNPLPHSARRPVRLLVDTPRVQIKDDKLRTIPCQINPIWKYGVEHFSVDSHKFELAFVADMPPLATLTFSLSSVKVSDESMRDNAKVRLTAFSSKPFIIPQETYFERATRKSKVEPEIVMENEILRVRIDPHTGSLLDVKDKHTGSLTKINLTFSAYKSKDDGPYIFTPVDQEPEPIKSQPVVTIAEGPVSTDVTIFFQDLITQTLTLYNHAGHLSSAVHIRNDIIETPLGSELIMRMRTDLHLSHPFFFSDKNGLQFVRRRSNPKVKIQGNYYPLTTAAFLDDGGKRVSLLSAQPNGVASARAGWLEVMLDRHMVTMDERGLPSGMLLKDRGSTSEFILLIETRVENAIPRQEPVAHYSFPTFLNQLLTDHLQHPPKVFYSPAGSMSKMFRLEPLKTTLPGDVYIVSLRSLPKEILYPDTSKLAYNGTSFIVHRRTCDCDFPTEGHDCSNKEYISSFSEVFRGFGKGVQAVQETSLTHMHVKRFHTNDTFHLHPMQIASYLLRF